MAQVKKVEVEQAIVQAAYQLFREHGYVNTRMPQIAKSAGISSSNIYVYFDSKFAILSSIYERWFAERLDELRDALEACRTPAEKLSKIVTSMWCDLPAADNGFSNNLIQALSTQQGLKDYQPSQRMRLEESLGRMLALCIPELAPAQHLSIANFLMMSFDGYALNHSLQNGKIATPDEIRFLCDMIMTYAENKPAAGK